jgi:rod shape-determining protein MreD
MTVPIAAVGAVIAAIVETSVLPELQVAGVNPDLVLVLTLVSAMLLEVEDGLIWAFLGGFMLDMLTPGNRAAGSTTLTLLIVTGVALLIARVSNPPRILTVVIAVFALTFLYQALLLVLLALTSGASLVSVPVASLALRGVLNAVLAAAVALGVRALYLRFGPAERTDW